MNLETSAPLKGSYSATIANNAIGNLSENFDDQLDAAQAALDKRLEKLAPMHFLLAHRDGNAQERTRTVIKNAHGQQYSSIAHLPITTHFFVARIKVEIALLAQAAFSPLCELLVKLLSGTADLHRIELHTAQLIGDRRHLADRDALHAHLGQGQGQCTFTAQTAFERRGIKAAIAHLREANVMSPTRVVTVLGLYPLA